MPLWAWVIVIVRPGPTLTESTNVIAALKPSTPSRPIASVWLPDDSDAATLMPVDASCAASCPTRSSRSASHAPSMHAVATSVGGDAGGLVGDVVSTGAVVEAVGAVVGATVVVGIVVVGIVVGGTGEAPAAQRQARMRRAMNRMWWRSYDSAISGCDSRKWAKADSTGHMPARDHAACR